MLKVHNLDAFKRATKYHMCDCNMSTSTPIMQVPSTGSCVWPQLPLHDILNEKPKVHLGIMSQKKFVFQIIWFHSFPSLGLQIVFWWGGGEKNAFLHFKILFSPHTHTHTHWEQHIPFRCMRQMEIGVSTSANSGWGHTSFWQGRTCLCDFSEILPGLLLDRRRSHHTGNHLLRY